MDETPSNPVEEIVKDAAQEARNRGASLPVREITDYVRGIVERAEKKHEEARHRVKSKPTTRERDVHRPDALNKEVATRLRRKGMEPIPGEWLVQKGDEVRHTRPIISSTKVKTEWSKRFGRRLKELRTKPEWKLRLDGPVAVIMASSDPDQRKKAFRTILDTVELSNNSLGDWRRDVRRRLFFDLG